MTDLEFQTRLNYLNARKNSVWIEVEMRHKDKVRFDTRYTGSTGFPVPNNSDTFPYYVWAANANPNDKWGIELRLYFISDNNLPAPLQTLAKNNSRHGYEMYDKRISNNAFIWMLFQNGYRLGQN
ncbi:MAG: hypothetical protein HY919_05720 [Elusimicrobia bacterium]|nr:hypothetical protein [Elusimicrobiota bacterium]